MSDYLADLNPGNLVNVVKQLAADVAQLKGRTVNIDSMDELTTDLGTMMAGEFRAGNGVEPGERFTGGRYGFPGFEYAGKQWFLVGVKNDTMMVGLDLETGSIYGAGGDLLIDDEGLTIAGLRSGIEINAIAVSPFYNRHFLMETIFNKSFIPSGALTLVDDDGDELLTNGDFELGDLSNWTPDDASEWSVNNEKPFEGVYCAKCELGVIDSGTLTSNQYAVTENVPYHITGRVAADSYFGYPNVYVDWYDAASGGNVLLSELVKQTFAGEIDGFLWKRYSCYLIAPKGALGMKVRLYSASQGEVKIYYDCISVKPCTIMRRLILGAEAEYFDGEKYRRLVTGKKTLFTPPAPTAALVTTGTGNVNNGAHLYKVTFADAEGETIASAASNSVTTDGTHKQVTVTIPLGPIGTVLRKIYRTAAGGINYSLLAVVSDNTTMTYTDNIADASLGSVVPTLNTTGGLSLYPTNPEVFGDAFVRNGSDLMEWLFNTSIYFSGYAEAPTTWAIGDNYRAGFMAKKGTYTFNAYLFKSTVRGIVDGFIDGVSIFANLDLYASTLTNYLKRVTSVVIDQDGWHEVSFVITGKNASAATPRLGICKVSLIRTGD